MRSRPIVAVLLCLVIAPSWGSAVERSFTLAHFGKLGGNPRDLSFPTPAIGYVVGDDFSYPANNFIAKTTDGGWTWEDITPVQLTERPWSVEFVNRDTGFVGAFNGLLLRTTDGGSTWSNVNNSGYGGSVYDIQFVTPDSGWASGTNAGGTILKTVDGGLSWTLINPGSTTTRYSILAYNGHEAVFSGNSGSVIRTTDGGASFTSGSAGTNTLYTLQAGRGDTVYVAGSRQLIFRSTDRGATFSLLYDLGESSLYAMAFAQDSSSAFVVGSNGINYRTATSWASLDSILTTAFIGDVCRAVAWLSPTDVVVGADHGTILRSSDGGTSWSIVESSTPYHAIDFFDGNNGAAVGWRGAILRTSDGGTTWVHMKGMQGPAELYDIRMVGPTTFYVCGSFNTVRLTTDGGSTFEDRSPPGTPPGTAKTMHFFAPNQGYCMGTNGQFYYTLSGGASWTSVFAFPTPNNDMEDVFFVNDTVGLAAGSSGRSAHTANRISWDSLGIKIPVPPYPSGDPGTVWELFFLNAETGYAGGNHGSLFKTTNAGASWTLQNDTTGLTLTDVYDLHVVQPDSIGFAVGDEGKVFRLATSSSWVLDTTITTVRNHPDRLYGMDFVSSSRAFVCGYYGTIYRLDVLAPLSIPVPVISGWNMVSNPVTTTNDSVCQLFPSGSFCYAFTFAGSAGYQQEYRMVNGKGYWGKFPASTIQPITGFPVQSASFPVIAGWNMIGSISFPVDTSTIFSVPPGIRSSQFFGYGAGYTPAPTIEPGKGYWVKANGPGVLLLNGTATERRDRWHGPVAGDRP